MPRVDAPLPGPDLAFAEWAELVTDTVREHLPDVRAARRGDHVIVWRLAAREATLTASTSDWWMNIPSSTGATGVSTHTRQHDAFTARVQPATSSCISRRRTPAASMSRRIVSTN